MSMQNTAPRKFNFDVDMSLRPDQSRVMTDDQMEIIRAEAHAEGHQQGFAEGQQTAEIRATQALADGAAALALRGAQLAGSVDSMRKATLGEAAHLARAIAQKLATRLIEKQPLGELETLIAECMASLDNAPHLVVRCHPDIADAVRETAEEKMTVSGFSGRLVVMGDPEIALGDGRIEWVDGGIVRDHTAMLEQIDKYIEAYLSANGVQPVEETKQ